MIRVKITIATAQRAYFDTCAQVYNDRIWVLSSRTREHRLFGKRDCIELHGNILNIVDFAHFLGNKHIRMAALKYIVTPYPKHSNDQQQKTIV